MAYEKQSWKTGDVVTSAKLNHMEDGIGNAGGVVTIGVSHIEDNFTLDKTWQEIYDTLREGVLCITQDDGLDGTSVASIGLITSAGITPDGHYYVYAIYSGAAGITSMEYTADAPDGYPSAED